MLRATFGAVNGYFAASNPVPAKQTGVSPEQIAAAKTAAYAAIPRTYELMLQKQSGKISFLVFGCQGNAKEAQRRTALLMDQMVKASEIARPTTTTTAAAAAAAAAASTSASNQTTSTSSSNTKQSATGRPVCFCVGLGDNFYDKGTPTPDDPVYQTCFYDPYSNKITVPHLAALPFFMLQGNHDQGRWKKGEFQEQIGLASTGLKGKDLGMMQVAHSYLPNPEAKQALYQQKQLPIESLPTWNMPSRYYSLICGQLQIFIIDSNTYASDYLELQRGIDVSPHNQARWLKEEVAAAKAAGREVMLALHHPLFTPGKRAYNSDITLYLAPDEIHEAKSLFKNTFQEDKPSYNVLLWEIFKAQDLTFKTAFAAHDHSLSYYNNRETCQNPRDMLCQIISAGAGGSLQQRRNFGQQNSMGCFLKKHGAVQVTFDPLNPADIQFDMISIDSNNHVENHITFSSEHCRPVRQFPTARSTAEIKEIEEFFAVIKLAIDKYCAFLGLRQDEHAGSFFNRNLTHRDEGIDRVHDLWAYINDSRTCQYEFARIVAGVHEIVSWRNTFSTPAEHSLITILNKKLKKKYRMTIDGLNQRCQSSNRMRL